MIEVQLATDVLELELYVEGYEFPRFDTGRDANRWRASSDSTSVGA